MKRMLRLDVALVQEEYTLAKEKAITDELITMGAFTADQLKVVLSARREEELALEHKWGKTAEKHGAMGDVVSNLLQGEALS